MGNPAQGETVYLILPRGGDFGWGVCGTQLVKELSLLRPVRYVSEPFGPADIADELEYRFLKGTLVPEAESRQIRDGTAGDVECPVLQAAANQGLSPWGGRLRGRTNIGYTFFEETLLTPAAIENGKRHYDVLVAGSTWCEQVLKNHGLNDTRTIIQGVDPQVFNPGYAQKRLLRDHFVIFSGGKFEFRKGQDLVIRAVKVLQERYPDVLLVHSWFNRWVESMKTMAASAYINFELPSLNYTAAINHILHRNGLDLDRVIGLLPRPNASMPALFRNTDVGLFPNRCEGGTNLVLMEYMACGKPAIASYSSGHRDILTPQNALMIQTMKPLTVSRSGDPVALWDDPDLEEIVSHLDWSYHHREELRAIGSRAGDDLGEKTWQRSAEAFYKLLSRAA